jgi:3-hydroxyacyl-CoA dehydrogenase/enoyl-CoA hydratase/3-hydroxybutyryl-CoA epimerase
MYRRRAGRRDAFGGGMTVLSHIGDTPLELGPARDAAPDGPWRLARDEGGIAWLVLERGDGSVNTVGRDVLEGLDRALDDLESDTPKALVIRSAKRAGFAAGADIDELKTMEDAEEVAELLREGLRVLDRLEAQDYPTVAVIHGHALGAGLELALACDHRIFIDNAHAAFPEVKLGLHPGLGGTVRLPALIDPVEAMTMMLTGKPCYAQKAKRLGLADAVTEERHLRAAIQAVADGDMEKTAQGWTDWAKSTAAGRAVAARQMRSKTEEKAPKTHYPAPHALIDLWSQEGNDEKAMQTAETASFANLLGSDTARNLMRVFDIREGLKKAGKGDHGIAHVHVVGAGEMGGDIATWCAIKGFRVTLFDIEAKAIAPVIPRAEKICKSEHLGDAETRDVLDRLIPDPDAHGVRHADLVIEAAPEKAELKRDIYAELEPRMKKNAVLASNTSSLSLGKLAKALDKADRFGGLHFFNPVDKMELVEVVRHDGTSDKTESRLAAFAAALDRLPAQVTDAPGFLVNRALTPYLMESLLLLDEGVEKEALDKVAERFGMPVGPVELADRVGLDICLSVADSLKSDLDTPLADIPDWMREKVAAGDLGQKSGQGFYEWSDGDPQKKNSPGEAPKDTLDRLILPMLNACIECRRKGVARDEDDIDAAMIFGTGFAPFRGGPMAYLRQRGIEDAREALERLEKAHGPRFALDPGWGDLA